MGGCAGAGYPQLDAITTMTSLFIRLKKVRFGDPISEGVASRALVRMHRTTQTRLNGLYIPFVEIVVDLLGGFSWFQLENNFNKNPHQKAL